MTPTETTQRIAELNDACRKAPGVAGRWIWTRAVRALPEPNDIFSKIQTFDAFTEGNDHHGERDFGAIECGGERIFWKIDYYAPDMEHGSEDPSDSGQTVRVLTIMLASEY